MEIKNENKIGKMGFILKIKLILKIILARKITFNKCFNAFLNQIQYLLKSKVASSAPSIVIVEPTNICNLACISCRTEKNQIFDYYPSEISNEIALGSMKMDVFNLFVEDVAEKSLLMALYLQGEPLMHSRIGEMVEICTKNKLATLIATNGILLDEGKSIELVEKGLDFIKIAVSGFCQETYERFHKKGNIEVIKRNIERLASISRERGANIYIMVDYFVFDYNKDEINLFKKFCNQFGIVLTLREGYLPKKFVDGYPVVEKRLPSTSLCAWLWHISVLNWNGSVLACCQSATSSGPHLMGEVKGAGDFSSVWNGEMYQGFRERHCSKGRGGIFLCDQCDWDAIGFQTEE